MDFQKTLRKKRLSWDEMFMNLAIIASKRTACLLVVTGCVFVDKNKRILSLGYNGPSEGDLHCNEVGCAKIDGDPVTKKLKRCRGAHAEINGITNCLNPKSLRGSTLYSVIFPCYDCMKVLNNAGIKEIVYKEVYQRTKTGGEEKEEETEAEELARNRGIIIRKYDGGVYVNFDDNANAK
jgi:dCMP deaminase